MSAWRSPCVASIAVLAAAGIAAFGLAACTSSTPSPEQTAVPTAAGQPAMPSQYRPEEVVGRWGYGAYHTENDFTRTAAAARGQCGQPVVINRGPNGGVMMYLADSAELQELQLKGSQSGKNYVGPPGDAGGPQDREIVSFDGRAALTSRIQFFQPRSEIPPLPEERAFRPPFRPFPARPSASLAPFCQRNKTNENIRNQG